MPSFATVHRRERATSFRKGRRSSQPPAPERPLPAIYLTWWRHRCIASWFLAAAGDDHLSSVGITIRE
jgi:hypothetical protein